MSAEFPYEPVPDPSGLRQHPAERDLERFMRCEAAQPESRAVVRHMLTGCPQCVAVTRKLWRFGEQSRALKVLAEEAAVIEMGSRRRLLEADGL